MNSPIGIYIISDNKFSFVNAKFQETSGFSEHELIGSSPLDLVLPEDRERVRANAIAMLKGIRKAPYQYRVRDKRGDVLWIMESVSEIHREGKRATLGYFMDVTENEGFTDAFMSSPIGIYIIQDGKFAFTNAKFRKITGYSKEELAEKPPIELVYSEDRELVSENARLMLKGQLTDPYQFRILNKAGEFRRITENVVSIRYRGKRAVLGNFMDITIIREIEFALKDSEKKYRSLFEMAREGIVLISYEDGSILDFNAEFLSQTGFDADSVRTKKIWEIQPVDFQKEAKETFFRFRETCGGIVSWKLCQHKGEDKELKILPVEIVAQQMVMENRDVIMCMVRDISEREAMMRALRLASEEWRKSFDAIGDVIMLIEPDFTISRANLAVSRLLKMPPKNIIGKKCYQLIHGTNTPPEYCPFLKAQAKGIYCEVESAEPHIGGTFVFSSSPMKNEDGEVTQVVEVISDVTSRRANEAESVRLSQTLASSFKGITVALSDLVESRDPYTAGHSRHVAEMAVLIGREIGLDADELEGLHICAILHDIGKVTIPAAILNRPGKLSTHEWGMIREHPTIAYETLQHIPFPWPVAQIVYQHHERLDGSGYPSNLKGDQIHPWARIISVADVLDAMTSHRPYRPGMPHRTAIEELESGCGTRYDPQFVEALIRSINLDDKRIMIIEIDPELINGLAKELNEEGFEAVGYSQPEDALEAFKEKPFPLVIAELYLPGMDGVHICRKIKEISHVTEVIMIAKYTSKEETLRVLRAGASDFLEKPLDLEIFIRSVHRAMRRFKGKK